MWEITIAFPQKIIPLLADRSNLKDSWAGQNSELTEGKQLLKVLL